VCVADEGVTRTGAGPDGEDNPAGPGSRPLPPRGPVPTVAVRVLALTVAVFLVVGSMIASLQIYFRQQREIAQLTTEIEQRQQAIDDLDRQLDQWDDPAYVEQQARERFGWVLPGETGYRVIGPDGKPLDGAALDSRHGQDDTPAADAWWLKLWGTAKTADTPTAAESEQQPVGEADASPSASPAPVGATGDASPTPGG